MNIYIDLNTLMMSVVNVMCMYSIRQVVCLEKKAILFTDLYQLCSLVQLLYLANYSYNASQIAVYISVQQLI